MPPSGSGPTPWLPRPQTVRRRAGTGDLAAENLLVRDGALTAVLDFGGLSVGDPTVDLVVAWEVLDPPARELFRGRSAWTTPPGCAAGRGHSPSP